MKLAACPQPIHLIQDRLHLAVAFVHVVHLHFRIGGLTNARRTQRAWLYRAATEHHRYENRAESARVAAGIRRGRSRAI